MLVRIPRCLGIRISQGLQRLIDHTRFPFLASTSKTEDSLCLEQGNHSYLLSTKFR